jgi:hypothetical protein
LIIFTLSLTVLLGLAGLAIDVMRAYDLYARELRAAEAGALAAVLDMPAYYTSTNPVDGMTAIQRALVEVQRNGFGAGDTPNAACDGANTSSDVMICTDSAVDGTALEVTLSQPISVFLLSAVGVQSFNVTATAGADYLYPYILGANPTTPANSNVWGDGNNTNNPKNYLASINGPGEFKESGDPFVYCEDGSSQGPPADGNLSTATTDLKNTVTGSDAGFLTNHVPYGTGSLCGTSQPDQQPRGFTGEATKNSVTHPGAYNFAIQVTSVHATIWIYNAPYSPADPKANCNGLQEPDEYFNDTACQNFYTQYGPTAAMGQLAPLTYNGHFDDPRFAFDMTYSMYKVPSIYSRVTDVLLPSGSQTFHPVDTMSADLSAHGCSGGYNLSQISTYSTGQLLAGGVLGGPIPFGVGCVTPSAQGTGVWTKLSADLDTVGLYRLAVEATPYVPTADPNPTCADGYMCGWGRHTYAIAVCSNGNAPASGNCASGGVISPWNNMDVYLNFPNAVYDLSVPIAYIPAAYKGRTITVSFFNPGDSHAHGSNSYFLLVTPDPCITVSYPTPTGGNNWVRQAIYPGTINPTVTGNCTQQTNGVYTAQSQGGQNPSDDIYNGMWVPMTFTLPTSYQGGEFYLDEHMDTGKHFEEMAVSAAINGGSPEHLIF